MVSNIPYPSSVVCFVVLFKSLQRLEAGLLVYTKKENAGDTSPSIVDRGRSRNTEQRVTWKIIAAWSRVVVECDSSSHRLIQLQLQCLSLSFQKECWGLQSSSSRSLDILYRNLQMKEATSCVDSGGQSASGFQCGSRELFKNCFSHDRYKLDIKYVFTLMLIIWNIVVAK